MFWWLIFVITVIVLYVRVVKSHFHWKERNVKHLTPWPIVGNFAPLAFKTKSFADHLLTLYNSFDERYFGFYQFLQPTMMLKDVELIKQIGIKDFDSFLDHRVFINEDIDPLFGKNLFALKGQKWRNMRSTLSPAFTGSKMRAMYALIADAAEQFTDYFLEQAKTDKKRIDVEMKDVFTRFANDVIATSAFGIKCDSLKDKDNEFYRRGKEATDFSGIKGFKFFGYNISPLLMSLFRVKLFSDEVSNFFRHLVHDTIAMREEKGIVRPDMIHLLMEAKKGKLRHEEIKVKDDAGFATVEESQVGKQNGYKPDELSDDEITAQAILFFFAGFDTISGNMCLLAHELAIAPDIQQRLQKEIDEAFDENNGKLTYDSIMKMKYLDMVVTEGLRKWPSAVMSDRVCTKPYTIQPEGDEEPLQLRVGDILAIPMYAIQRDPKYYPNPDKFDPERFSDENKDKINPSAYLPFGLGPRNCIGSRFALLELKTVFCFILRVFNIIPNEKTKIPLVLSKKFFNLNAEGGFQLSFQPRTSI